LSRSRLRTLDLGGVAAFGLRTRRLRALLAALGIAVGVASMVGVLGITQSSQAELLDQIQRLGTNLLTVQNGRSFGGGEAELPLTTAATVGVVPGVHRVTATQQLVDVNVYRSDLVPAFRTGGLGVRACDTALLETLGGRLLRGVWFGPVTARHPTTVLGYGVALALGIDSLEQPVQIWMGGRWFHVIGILDQLPLAPEIDRSALIGFPAAAAVLAADGHPSHVYLRAEIDRIPAIERVLARSVDPANPEQVQVNRPSDALAAQLAVRAQGLQLFLGLGGVALLVGGVGIANVMFVSVLERRSEIGLRRALGATRLHVGLQFLSESVLLGTIGGAAGAGLGGLITAGWASTQSWRVVVPPLALAGGMLTAALVGGVAGLYPAARAARLPPSEALRS
jgi:putative ABC transport system permease protein